MFRVLVSHWTVTPGGARPLLARTMRCPRLPLFVAAVAASASRNLYLGLMALTSSSFYRAWQKLIHFNIAVARSSPPTLNQYLSPQRSFSLESCTCALFEQSQRYQQFLSWTASKTESSSQHAWIQQICLSHSLIISRFGLFPRLFEVLVNLHVRPLIFLGTTRLPRLWYLSQAPKPLVRAVVDDILQPKLRLPRLSYSQFSLSHYRLCTQNWQLPERQSQPETPEVAGRQRSAHQTAAQSCGRKYSERKCYNQVDEQESKAHHRQM